MASPARPFLPKTLLLLACLVALTPATSCRKPRVLPVTLPPTYTPTHTPTATLTPTPTRTNPPTATPTVTFVHGVVCTVTPTGALQVPENEPADAWGHNDFCSGPNAYQDLGALTSDAVVVGVLSSTAGGAANYAGSDFDYYHFSTGTAGTWRVTLDCFTSGLDGRNDDLLIVDASCTCVLLSGDTSASVETVSSASLPVGAVFNVLVIGADGPSGPYRLTIDAP